MDKDGVEELILQSFSGGAHCCWDLHIIKLSPKLSKPIDISLGNSDVSFKDIDGDGRLEWIMYDDVYSYFLTCFACSPSVEVIANYQEGKLHLRPKLIEKYTRKNLKKHLKLVRMVLDSDGDITPEDEERFSLALGNFLYYFYSGRVDDALRVIYEHFSFKNRAVKMLFLLTLSKQISNSYFWDDLRRINTLYDKDIYANTKEMYDSEYVAKYFFTKLEKMEKF